MADTFKFQKDWYDAIVNDKYVNTTPQEMAYILYAAMQYAFNGGTPIDMGEVFGKEFAGLNRSMPNIYGQMDKIRNYEVNRSKDIYDQDAIYKLRMEGKTGKEICKILGYSLDKERSLSSTKGWKKAKKDLEKNDTDICTDSVFLEKNNSVKGEEIQKTSVKNTDSVQKSVKNTENVQICTNTDDTESVKSVQNSVNFTDFKF